MMLACVVAGTVLAVYAASLWWLLRRESVTTLLVLGVVTTGALALRLLFTNDYPAGLDEHETRILGCYLTSYRAGRLFGDCFGAPTLFSGAFGVVLFEVFGGLSRWPMRGQALLTGVLAVPAAFAVGRALGLRVAPSLAAAAFVAVLPWSMLYSRLSLGAELVFHQLLLLAALARLVRQRGRWAETLMGGAALCLLLYDYFAGRAMLGMPLVAAVLARGYRRLLCLLVIVLALGGYAPYLRQGSDYAGVGVTTVMQSEGGDPIGELRRKTARALESLVRPVGVNYFFTVEAGAMHPPLVLGLALLGALTGLRRGLFLLGGFAGGVAPTVLSSGANPSSHRMLMAYAFIAIAAGAAFQSIPWRRPRGVAVAAAALWVGMESVALYFSPRFWPPQSRGLFSPDETAVMQALPLEMSGRLVVTRQLYEFYAVPPLFGDRIEQLHVANWRPPNGVNVVYAFDRTHADLLPFYELLVGPARVRAFGRCFLVTLAADDWSWIARHGWAYEASCGGERRRGQVPTLYQSRFSFGDLPCHETMTHRWRGRWQGPPAHLRMRGVGRVTVEKGSEVAVDMEAGDFRGADFRVDGKTDLAVTVTAAGNVWAGLLEVTPAGERVPAWERVTPLPWPEPR